MIAAMPPRLLWNTAHMRMLALQAADRATLEASGMEEVSGPLGLSGFASLSGLGVCDPEQSAIYGHCVDAAGWDSTPVAPAPSTQEIAAWQQILSRAIDTTGRVLASRSGTPPSITSTAQASASAQAAAAGQGSGQLIPGVRNEYLIYGALGLIGVLVVGRAMG